MFVTGLVLAAGDSRRLGRPKQLLPVEGRPLLDLTLEMARACHFDELLVTIGGAAAEVRAQVDLTGCQVVDNVDHTSGCSSSIVVALQAVDERSTGIVMLLGDQPGVDPLAVARLIDACRHAALGVCHYDDGIGHPFWFGREMIPALGELHGDKAVWKLIESGRWPVTELTVGGRVPLDVDTDEDYEQLLESRR